MANRHLGILVVEDKQEERETIVLALKDACYYVDSCSNIEEAYLLVDRKENYYQIVILDLLIGYEFEPSFYLIEQIGRISPATRIIILSSHGSTENAARAVKNGAFDFVPKPLNIYYNAQDIAKVLLPKIEQALTEDDYFKFNERKKALQQISEDQLIDQVLIPLLCKIGYLGVQRNAFHGPGEQGKDILPFYKYGDFRERIYYCAQVKVGNVSARSGAKSNVHIILDQVKSALSLNFIDKFDGSQKKLDHCLVVCSGKISKDAKELLEQAFEGRRDIILIEANDLVDLMRRFNFLNYFDRMIIMKRQK